MKHINTILLACLVISGLLCENLEASSSNSKKSHKAQTKPKAKALASKKSDNDKKSEKSVAPAKHYIYPRSSLRPKNQKPGVVLSSLSIKGNCLVPYGKDSKKDLHDGMMHIYENTFHAKHGHVLEIMQAIVETNSSKEFAKFKKAVNRIHASSDDWNALKDAVSLYNAFACKQVELFEKQRLQKREPELNNKLQKAVTKIAHTQSALMYASHSLAHSRNLLEEYAQDPRLDQYIKNAEKALKSNAIQNKFNTSDKRLVQTRNRLVALCVLLEGAIVHDCAVQDALVTDMEKQSVPVQKTIDAIIKEIKQTLLA